MNIDYHLTELGFTRYEVACYLSLLRHSPVNGSQLSRHSGVPRSKIYDVLHRMVASGLVVELEDGLFAPLPPDELGRRLRSRFESNMLVFEQKVKDCSLETYQDYVWTVRGLREILRKARDMVRAARSELYVRLHPPEAAPLLEELLDAQQRGVALRYLSMGQPPGCFQVEAAHPEPETLEHASGGRLFDIIVDRREALSGMIDAGDPENSAVKWTRSRWFIIAAREAVRNEFYHALLFRLWNRDGGPEPGEVQLFELIRRDQWID